MSENNTEVPQLPATNINADVRDPEQLAVALQAMADELHACSKGVIGLATVLGLAIAGADASKQRVTLGYLIHFMLNDPTAQASIGGPVLDTLRAALESIGPPSPDGGSEIRIVVDNDRKAA